jgi:general secretion pathway protein G
MRTIREESRRRSGFTLMEVLLVLAILVIIASIVSTAIFQMQRKGYTSAAKTQVKALKGPLQAYRLDLNSYPSTAQGLDALRRAPGDLANAGKWSGPYLDEAVPLDPWLQPYHYEYPGKHNQDLPDIWSVGPDGVDGTDDDVGNWEQE